MNKDVVILVGKFTDRIDNDEYILSDGRGTILVKLDGELKYYARSDNLVNILLEITGKVERKNNPLKIKVRGRQNLRLNAAQ